MAPATTTTTSANSMPIPVTYTPTTGRVSKAKKGKKVHVCEYGCGKVFTRAEHRKYVFPSDVVAPTNRVPAVMKQTTATGHCSPARSQAVGSPFSGETCWTGTWRSSR